MKGFYFINTDIGNTRAHTCQILNTAVSVGTYLPFIVIAPKYHKCVDLDDVSKRHNLSARPQVELVNNFGIKKPGAFAFALFNLPAIFFLFIRKIKKEVSFIYIRSSLFLPLVAFSFLIGIPVFYETHRRPLSVGEKFRDHLISKMSAGIIVISDYMKEHYLKYNKKILTVHDAVSFELFDVDISKEDARKQFDIDMNQKVCVYTGTISKLKGVNYIFDTARILPKVAFLLAGSVSRELVNLELPSNVKLLGRKKYKEIPILLKSADVLLLPHPKGEYSQSPMKLFEYMASGIPIVASKLPSVLEILNDENAVLVEAEDDRALARGIVKILENKSYADTIAQKAYNDAQDYTWEKRGKKIAEFIK